MFTLRTIENNEISSANRFAFDKSSMRPFMYIRNGSRVIVEPRQTHALTSAKERTCPLSTTLCFRLLKILNNKLKMLSDMPFCFTFKIMSSCHTLSNALKIAIYLMIYSIFFM